jgi:hypothetical protein
MRNRPTGQAGGSQRTATGVDAVPEITRYSPDPIVIDTKVATVTYTAEIKACGCDEPSTCKRGWHEPKVLQLAQRTSKTYI